MENRSRESVTLQAVQSPFLSSLLEEEKAVMADAQDVLNGCSAEQLSWQPDPKSWSILECFGHLVIFGNLYYPRISRLIEYGRDRGVTVKADFRPSWFGKRFIGAIHPDTRMRLRTFKAFKPGIVPGDLDLRERFIDQQLDLIELIKQADGLDLNVLKLRSPVSSLLRFSLGEALWLQVVHQQRHLKQIHRILDHDQFPVE